MSSFAFFSFSDEQFDEIEVKKSFPGGCCWKNWPQDDVDVDVTNYSSRAYTHTYTGGWLPVVQQKGSALFSLRAARHRFSSLFIFHRVKKTHIHEAIVGPHTVEKHDTVTLLYSLRAPFFCHDLFIYFPLFFMLSVQLNKKSARIFTSHPLALSH